MLGDEFSDTKIIAICKVIHDSLDKYSCKFMKMLNKYIDHDDN